MKMTSANVFSSPADLRFSLRWIAIISSLVKEVPLAASTGVHSGTAVVKQLLAGARAVHVCSVLYKEGPEYLSRMKKELEDWMDRKEHDSIDAFKGKLSSKAINDPFVYKRAQYIDMILKSDEYFNPVV